MQLPTEGRPSQLTAGTWWLALCVGIATLLLFWDVQRLGWTNWDDDRYVYENEAVRSGDYLEGFRTPFLYGYKAFPALTWTFEWQWTEGLPLEERAWRFHFDNLLLHAISGMLVVFLLSGLGLRPLYAAVGAALWCLHPLRVESVAWIAERKDMLLGLGYLSCLLAYLAYLRRGRWPWLILAGLLYALAVLSKVQAVTIPICMLVVDAYLGRGLGRRVWLEKLPFFAASLVMGVLGIYAMWGTTANYDLLGNEHGLVERLGWSVVVLAEYYLKFLVPWEMTTYYPPPEPLWLWAVLGGIFLVALAWICVRWRRQFPWVTAGVVWCFINLVFVLPVLDNGYTIGTDRLGYVPHVGLAWAVATSLQWLAGRGTAMSRISMWLGAVAIAILGVLTVRQVPVWHDSGTLWTDVIESHPGSFVYAYVNRSLYLRSQGQEELAMADLDTAVAHWPGHEIVRLNRGNLYYDTGRLEEAASDYTTVIEGHWPLSSRDSSLLVLQQAYRNRGVAMVGLGYKGEGLADLRTAIAMDGDDFLALLNRGLVYQSMDDCRKALVDFGAARRLAPADGQLAAVTGQCHARLGMFAAALADFDVAISGNPRSGELYALRAQVHYALGNEGAAEQDMMMSVQLLGE